MAKGLLKLNDDELKFLEHRISHIDLQKGCPVQCVVCGASAEKYSFNMPWKNFVEISESILEIKAKKKIYLLQERDKIKKRPSLALFRSSDPIYYRSSDGAKERTLWDVIEVLLNNHKISTHITTSGWRPGNNYMQRAVEKIVNAKKHGNNYIGFTYSVKTVSEKTIKEYKQIKSLFQTSDEAINKFIIDSSYSRQLSDNMLTLKGAKTNYSKQYIDDGWFDENMSMWEFSRKMFLQMFHLNSSRVLPGEYESLKELFTQKTVDYITNYCASKANLEDVKNDNYKAAFWFNDFGAIGKAKLWDLRSSDDIGIDRIYLEPEKDRWKKNIISQDEYSFGIDAHGTLNIFLGDELFVVKTIIPKSYFETRAEYYKNKDLDKSKYFTMLANLQGKRLIG